MDKNMDFRAKYLGGTGYSGLLRVHIRSFDWYVSKKSVLKSFSAFVILATLYIYLENSGSHSSTDKTLDPVGKCAVFAGCFGLLCV